MTCEIVTLTSAGYGLAGRVMLGADGITTTAEPGYELPMANIVNEPIFVGRNAMHEVTAGKDPQAFFDGLEQVFSGTYLRARFSSDAKRLAPAD